MASFPLFPMWVRDYLADTSHLDATEHGVYHLLLYRYWLMDGAPLSEDLTLLRRVCRCRSRAPIERILAEFWDHEPGVGYTHQRVDAELFAVREKSAKARKSALSRHAKRKLGIRHPQKNANEINDDTPAVAVKTLCSPYAYTKEETKNSNVPSRGYDERFESAWKLRPRRSGNDSKKRAYSSWNARLGEGHEPATISEGVDRYRVYCELTGKVGTEYVMMMSTFLGPGNNRFSGPEPENSCGKIFR